MAILNYTTTISVDKTVAEIEKVLVAHGAKNISKDYESSQAVALLFMVPTRFGDKDFRLPVDTDGIWRVMTEQYHAGKIRRRFVTKEQAARVGWRIILDWVKAQMAIIEAEMVTMEQVMLPYLLDAGGHTVYEVMVGKQLALPEGRADGQ